MESMQVIHASDRSVVTALQPVNQPKLYVVKDSAEREISLQETLGELSYPLATTSLQVGSEKDLGTAGGLVVVPLVGGGRGPIINYGETITLSLLFSLLANALTKDQLSPALLTQLDQIVSGMPNTKDQYGYATHNETVVLSHLWTGYPPIIEISPAPGPALNIIHTVVGEDPDCITYVEIPRQELVYGHSGVVNHQQFTVRAAILEKTEPLVKEIDWAPAGVIGPPLTALTALSLVSNTTAACMGLRIKGSLSLTNFLAYAVSGAMYAQMSVDSGPWVNVAALHWSFKENESITVSEYFDEILVFDHSQHSYQFRGQLVTISGEETERELIGSLHIGTVTEFGSGAVLSNDLLVKWASKEKL